MKIIANLSPVVLLFVVACINDQGSDTNQFGSPYKVIQTQAQPSLTTDSLFVAVAYSGCEGNHTFSLKYRVFSSTAEVWLVKETPGQMCDAYFEEVKAFPIPNEVQNSLTVVLLGPKDETFSLK